MQSSKTLIFRGFILFLVMALLLVGGDGFATENTGTATSTLLTSATSDDLWVNQNLVDTDSEPGMHADSDNGVVINNSSVSTVGLLAHGMVAGTGVYGGLLATNIGLVVTSGDQANGMYAQMGSILENRGTIITDGVKAHGMYAWNNSSADNYGTIETGGAGSHGMVAFQTSKIFHYGLETIETWGDGSHGMEASYFSYAENSGSIITHGDDAWGMYAVTSSDVKNTETGSITTWGAGSHGMVA
ncbi:MAG: hypothetical protein ACP5DY_07580, partial [Thermovirgaceae bacterium]